MYRLVVVIVVVVAVGSLHFSKQGNKNYTQYAQNDVNIMKSVHDRKACSYASMLFWMQLLFLNYCTL